MKQQSTQQTRNLKPECGIAISTGTFGYPIEEETNVVVETIKIISPKLEFVKTIRFVLFSKHDFEVYDKIISEKL
ncbi:MAG: hypothetical protein ACK4WJ_02805 [Endomicrobiia bacterium]